MGKYLIAGLGNPGLGYRKNRHNAGYIVLDEIVKGFGQKISGSLYGASYCRIKNSGNEYLFIKPQLYMNNSGVVVKKAMEKEDIGPESLIVIYDDIDLPFGTVRIRKKGSAGTHNGMRSIISQIGTEEFKRIRIGIDKPKEGVPLAKYVLGNFSRNQMTELKKRMTAEISEQIFGDFLNGNGGNG